MIRLYRSIYNLDRYFLFAQLITNRNKTRRNKISYKVVLIKFVLQYRCFKQQWDFYWTDWSEKDNKTNFLCSKFQQTKVNPPIFLCWSIYFILLPGVKNKIQCERKEKESNWYYTTFVSQWKFLSVRWISHGIIVQILYFGFVIYLFDC